MPKLKEAAEGCGIMFFSCWGCLLGAGGERKRWFYFQEQGYQPYNSGLEPGTIWEFRRATGVCVCVCRESAFGGEEAYNSKLQPLGTYWQLNHVAELNQTYATMDRASPKCTNTQESVYSANSP